MREAYELRLFSKYFPQIAGKPSPSSEVRVVATTLRGIVGDPQFARIGELQQELQASRQGSAFAGWEIKRSYNAEELRRARLFLLNIPFKHLSAEEYGTEYEQSNECEHETEVLEQVEGTEFRISRRKLPCSLLSKQIDQLRLPYRKLGNRNDIFRLWGGEMIVSRRFGTLVNEGKFSGARFLPTSNAAWASHPTSTTSEFAQLVVRSRPLQVSKEVRFGATPFDSERTGYQHCGAGTIAGSRLLTPLSVNAASWDGSDICRTEVYVGARQGLFRPYQLLIASKRLLDALQQREMKGFRFEIVELD